MSPHEGEPNVLGAQLSRSEMSSCQAPGTMSGRIPRSKYPEPERSRILNAQQAEPMVRLPRNQIRSSAADARFFGAEKLLVISSSMVLLHTSAAAPSW